MTEGLHTFLSQCNKKLLIIKHFVFGLKNVSVQSFKRTNIQYYAKPSQSDSVHLNFRPWRFCSHSRKDNNRKQCDDPVLPLSETRYYSLWCKK